MLVFYQADNSTNCGLVQTNESLLGVKVVPVKVFYVSENEVYSYNQSLFGRHQHKN